MLNPPNMTPAKHTKRRRFVTHGRRTPFRLSHFKVPIRLKRAAHLLLAVCLTVLLGGCGKAGPASSAEPRTLRHETEQGPARLIVEVDPARPRLADDVTLRLTLQVDAGIEVFPPEFADQLGDFRIRDVRSLPPRYSGRQDTYVYELLLEPSRTGPLRLLPIALTFRDPRRQTTDQRRVVESTEMLVHVDGPTSSEAPQLDEMGLTGPVAAGQRWRLLPLVATAVTVVIVATLVWRLWSRRRRTETVTAVASPRELALSELEQLAAEGLAERDVKRFFVRLTAIVRMFIERTTGVLAVEQTTEEFLRAIGDDNVFGREDQLRLKEFLESADLIKFAARQPRRDDVEDAFGRAREFVMRQTEAPSDTGQSNTGQSNQPKTGMMA